MTPNSRANLLSKARAPLERMKMAHLLARLDGVCERAAQRDADYKTFLARALEAESRGRYQKASREA